jgi:hypothetical protein
MCCACVALVFCARASANVAFGITEDTGALGDPALFYSTLNDLGATENRIAITWDPANPTAIPAQPALDVWVPEAAIHGVRLIFAVSPARPRDVTASPARIAQFAAFLAQLARTYPSVKDFVVGNEPNQNRFWQPQFDPASKRPASGLAYEPLLAAGYDALKGVDPAIDVIGIGLSPRGNDNPFAKDNVSVSPVRFLHDVGVAYRASKRTKPLMDELGFHPYPNQNNDPPLKGYPWPNAGIPNLDRVKQAVWDAFNGTAQPTFAERGQPSAGRMLLDLDETGWQVAIRASIQNLYSGKESVTPIDEGTQAQYYADIVRFVSCDPNVRSLSFFHLVDERDLDRWQSGLMRIDGTKRPSYTAVKTAIAQTHGQCALTPPGWQRTTTVTGAAVQFGFLTRRSARNRIWRFRATAQENATWSAGIFRLGKPKVSPAARRAVLHALASPRAKPLLRTKGTAKAYASTLVKLQKRGLKRGGWYVYGVRLASAMNAQRTNSYISRPFRVLAPPRR